MERILWLANVRALPFAEQLDVASKGGFERLTTSPGDVDRTLATGLSIADMRAMAADRGVTLDYLDPLASWVPEWQPDDMDDAMRTYLDRSPEAFFALAEALGVETIHAIGTFPEERYSVDYLTERYAALCDRAAESGLRCTIEAIPHWGLRSLETVWQIVKDANRPNSGIVFDNWHYLRYGRNDALLQTIPPGVITTVQLADGPAELPPGRSLIDDCVYYRQPIGEGEMPIAEIVALLREAGHLTSIGPEIFSHELDSLSPDAILERILPGLDALVAQTTSPPNPLP
ncbi:MAG: sugar phosphate isomerase/epimerase family protein [Armatimonas sp.]